MDNEEYLVFYKSDAHESHGNRDFKIYLTKERQKVAKARNHHK